MCQAAPARRLASALLALALVSAGCDSGTGDPADGGDTVTAEPVTFCEGGTSHVYDPLVGTELDMFPDDFLTIDDATSATGVRVDAGPDRAPWVATSPDVLKPSMEALGTVNGFGTNAGGFLRFSAPVIDLPTGPEESVTSDALMLLDLGGDTAVRVPYETVPGDEGRDVIVWPMRPLRRATPHALVATTALQAEDGGCVSPGATLRSLLEGTATDPRLARLLPRYATLLTMTGLSAGDISAAAVFTTHDELSPVFEVAADIRTREFAWKDGPSCSDEEKFRRCEGTFDAWDYRGDRVIDDVDPDASWTLPVSVWLPKTGSGPFPTLMFGHGINSSRGEGAALADWYAPQGFAVVAADAIQHGDHPTVDAESANLAALRFLGIDLEAIAVDALALRGNFNQTLADRLQLIELLKQAPDMTGDGAPDIDTDRLAWYGISLGGMMGSSMLAASGDFDAGVFAVAGGRLLTFATDTAQVKPFWPFLVNLIGSEALLERLLVVAQALVDPADPASFAPHVLQDRLVGGDVPDVLFHVAIEDDTVPLETGKALARALGIPHVGEVLVDVGLIPVDPDTPVSGNVAGGAATAGYLQMDRVSAGGGVEPAAHPNVPFSPEARVQAELFLDTALGEGPAVISDPYAVLGTPPLE